MREARPSAAAETPTPTETPSSPKSTTEKVWHLEESIFRKPAGA